MSFRHDIGKHLWYSFRYYLRSICAETFTLCPDCFAWLYQRKTGRWHCVRCAKPKP